MNRMRKSLAVQGKIVYVEFILILFERNLGAMGVSVNFYVSLVFSMFAS